MNFSLSFVHAEKQLRNRRQYVSVESTNWTKVYHRMHHIYCCIYLKREESKRMDTSNIHTKKYINSMPKLFRGKKKSLSHNWLSNGAIRNEEKQVTKKCKSKLISETYHKGTNV